MFVAANFVKAVAYVLNTVLEVYMWMVIIRALLSWVNPDPYNPIVRFLVNVTDPVLRPLRRLVGVGMGIDFSPMIVILAIYFLKMFVVQTLFDMASRMR